MAIQEENQELKEIEEKDQYERHDFFDVKKIHTDRNKFGSEDQTSQLLNLP